MDNLKLPHNNKVIYGISSKSDGNIDPRFQNYRSVQKNLEKITKRINVNKHSLVQVQQVHGTKVSLVTKKDQGKILPNSDGLITNDPQVTLMLRIADCIPIFIFDPNKRAIGLVHSGWRGTVGKIILVAMQKMITEFGTDPSELKLFLGPSIQACCNKVKDPMQHHLPEWKPFIKKRNSDFAVDLPGFVAKTAKTAGVKESNIKLSDSCTFTSNNLFSYARWKKSQEKEGRFASLVKLTEHGS